MSETAERTPLSVGGPAGPAREEGPSRGAVRRSAALFAQQREATVFVVAVAAGDLLRVHRVGRPVAFLTKHDIVNISQITAPIAIIAIGEVFLLICGEIDLSVGFIFTFSPFLMHYLIDFYGVPGVLAVFLSLLMGLVVGWA